MKLYEHVEKLRGTPSLGAKGAKDSPVAPMSAQLLMDAWRSDVNPSADPAAAAALSAALLQANASHLYQQNLGQSTNSSSEVVKDSSAKMSLAVAKANQQVADEMSKGAVHEATREAASAALKPSKSTTNPTKSNKPRTMLETIKSAASEDDALVYREQAALAAAASKAAAQKNKARQAVLAATPGPRGVKPPKPTGVKPTGVKPTGVKPAELATSSCSPSGAVAQISTVSEGPQDQ